jgi:hypothetical protein
VVANYKNTLRVKNWHEALIEMAQTRDEHIAEQLEHFRKPGMYLCLVCLLFIASITHLLLWLPAICQ